MKIGIIGDLHIGSGYNLGKPDPETQLNSRLLDFSNTLDNIIDQFIKNSVSVIVFTGDIFDTRHPTSAQLKIFSRCINKITSQNMKAIIVAGNHDQQRTISTTTVDIYNELGLPNVKAYSDINVHIVSDENGNPVNLVLVPYKDRRMMKVKTNAEAAQKLKEKIHNLTRKLSGPKIAVGHLMIDRAVTGQGGESFSVTEIIAPFSVFQDIDVVIMGHVHKHAILRKKNPLVVYSGSMDKVSFGERNDKKVSIILDTNDLLNANINQTKTRNLYEMNFDYSDNQCYKHQITDKVIKSIERFHSRFNLAGSIVKLVLKLKEDDLYHLDQYRIKEYILNKKIRYITPMQISTISSRKLRNKNINEIADGKKAMSFFIKELTEPEDMKEKLHKFADNIITEVEGK